MEIARKCVVVFLLSLLNFLVSTERSVVGGLLGQVAHYYSISDSTSGLLQTVYVVVYVVVAPIWGYLGDRYNRKLLCVVGCVIWAVLILASSFVPAGIFWLFMILRAFSGLGDAVIMTLAPSLLRDMFKGKGRGYSLMMFYYSLPVGWSVSTIIASQIIQAQVAWQWGLRIIPPVAAVAIIALLFVLEEPPRSDCQKQDSAHTSLWEDVKANVRIKSFLFSLIVTASYNIVFGAQGWWNPSMIQLAMKSTNSSVAIFHGESYALIQSIIGIENTSGGIIGGTLSVWLSTLWAGGVLCIGPSMRAIPLVGGIGILLASPTTLFVQHFYLIDINWHIVVGFYGCIMTYGTNALSTMIVMKVIPSSRMGVALAIFNIFGSLLGDAPSPYIVGAIADHFRDPDAVDQAGDHLNALFTAHYFSNAFIVVCCVAFFACAYFIVEDEIALVVEENEEDMEYDNEKRWSGSMSAIIEAL